MTAAKGKTTRAFDRALKAAKGAPVRGVVFAAIDSDKLTLSSFAERARQRNVAVRERLGAVMARVQQWEGESGQTVPATVRPDDAAVVLTAPAALFEALAADDAVAAIDADTESGAGAA